MLTKWKKELSLLMVFAMTVVAGQVYATTCYTSGTYGRTYYCSIRCTCNDGTIQFASSDCTAIHKCCRWTLTYGANGSCAVSTYCAACLPI